MWELRVVREVTDCEGRSVQGPAGQLRLQAGSCGILAPTPRVAASSFLRQALYGGRGSA